MDPQLRKLLEVAYEAWVDTGDVVGMPNYVTREPAPLPMRHCPVSSSALHAQAALFGPVRRPQLPCAQRQPEGGRVCGRMRLGDARAMALGCSRDHRCTGLPGLQQPIHGAACMQHSMHGAHDSLRTPAGPGGMQQIVRRVHARHAGYEQTGCAQSMFANRLSWYFDFRGPSKCIDTGVHPFYICMQNLRRSHRPLAGSGNNVPCACPAQPAPPP